MKYLFDKDGLEALEAFCRAPCLFAFDYDGTLAPIVDDPHHACMRDKTRAELEQLGQWSPVAVISGRRRSDLSLFLPRGIDYRVGNHGFEGIASGVQSLEAAAQVCRTWQEQLKLKLGEVRGLLIEDKTYSLSIHYRHADDHQAAQSHILNVISQLSPSPRLVMGKFVFNVVVDGAPHKGVAIMELLARSSCQAAVYVGDDDNDEDVFRLSAERILTVRVGPSPDTAAMFYLQSQEEIDKLLELSRQLLAQTAQGKPRQLQKLSDETAVDIENDLPLDR